MIMYECHICEYTQILTNVQPIPVSVDRSVPTQLDHLSAAVIVVSCFLMMERLVLRSMNAL